VLGLIVAFGLASVGFARYDYRHPPAGPTKSYAAIAFYACGELLPSLAPSVGTYQALAGGVLSSDTTGTPTLNQFVSAYPGLKLSSSELQLPAGTGKHAHPTTYTNDQKCPTGTKDAGKAGHVEIAYWPTLGSATPTLTTDPSSVPISTHVQISVAFLPTGVTPARPPASIIAAMESATGSAAIATTTTTRGVTSTTAKATH
jgi:hypothetical protein